MRQNQPVVDDGPDAVIRAALRPVAVAFARGDGHPIGLVEEFTLPPGGVRADVAVVGPELIGYEIKSAADSLRRLPGQAAAFGRVFDTCWLVAATRHVHEALDCLPSWWGIIEVEDDPQLTRLVARREAARSPAVEVDVLVRLLWREEVAAAICAHGHEPALRRGRSGLWAQLLDCGTEASIRAAVRDALRSRRSWLDAAGRQRLTLMSAAAP